MDIFTPHTHTLKSTLIFSFSIFFKTPSMESLSLFLSPSPLFMPLKPNLKTPQKFHLSPSSNFPTNQVSIFLNSLPFKTSLKPHFPLPLLMTFLSSSTLPLPCFASEIADPTGGKIDIESALLAIDDFFNKNPFFVSGVTFIWLIVIPLVEEYLKKYKYVSAINAFRKLRDDSSVQLLDIRDGKSLGFMGSPNLRILNKGVIQVGFSEDDEDGFLKKVRDSFGDPQNTVVCILDNFDGNSIKVAELLVKNGFKEAYAIKGGLRGKKGWQEIQQELLPPSVHVYPKKKVKKSRKVNNVSNQPDADQVQAAISEK